MSVDSAAIQVKRTGKVSPMDAKSVVDMSDTLGTYVPAGLKTNYTIVINQNLKKKTPID